MWNRFILIIFLCQVSFAQKKPKTKMRRASRAALKAISTGESPSSLSKEKFSSYIKKLSLEEIQGKKVFCLAGIASPESFFNLVESLGGDVIENIVYPDHHFFKVEEINQILEKAIEQDAYVITTEKDIVKIRRIIDDPRLLYLEIQVDFVAGKEDTLKTIDQVI